MPLTLSTVRSLNREAALKWSRGGVTVAHGLQSFGMWPGVTRSPQTADSWSASEMCSPPLGQGEYKGETKRQKSALRTPPIPLA